MGRRQPIGAAAGLSAAGVMLLIQAALSPAAASNPEQEPPGLHLFFGADAASHSFFSHQGLVWAPLGHLHEPGLRLRGLTSAGAYLYQGYGIDIVGQNVAAEIMPGFQWMTGSYGVTIYGGLAIEDYRTLPMDPGKPRLGTHVGGKVLVETWARLADGIILDASGEYGTASRSYAVRLAVKLSQFEPFMLEPEIMAFGEPGYSALRVGIFARLYRSTSTHVLAGGGWTFASHEDGPYAGLRIKRWR